MPFPSHTPNFTIKKWVSGILTLNILVYCLVTLLAARSQPLLHIFYRIAGFLYFEEGILQCKLLLEIDACLVNIDIFVFKVPNNLARIKIAES